MSRLNRTGSWPIVDFHVHIHPPWWTFKAPPGGKAGDQAWYRSWGSKLTAPEVLVRETEAGGVDLSLLSSTIEGISGIRGPVDHGEVQRHNDYLATLVDQHGGRFAALAAADAFSGDTGAREAERAVKELGHVGIVIDSARDGVFAGDPVTRPVFEAAAQLKVPILVHPVAAENAAALTAAAGRAGNSFGRGHVNGTAFLSVVESGLLNDLPDLDVVFTGIGLGALVIAAAEVPAYSRASREAGKPRPNVYFDFMGFSPEVLRFALGVLGPERVLVGSDWPIWESLTRQKLLSVFAAAEVGESDRRLIAGGNAGRILGRRIGDEEQNVRSVG